MNAATLLKAGFIFPLHSTQCFRGLEVGSMDEGSHDSGEFRITAITGVGLRAEAKLDSWRSEGAHQFVGYFDTEEEAIKACEEWEAVENGKRILMPEKYRNRPLPDAIEFAKSIAIASSQMGKTAAAMKKLQADAEKVAGDLQLIFAGYSEGALKKTIQRLMAHDTKDPKDPC
jgi:hypothetical protein